MNPSSRSRRRATPLRPWMAWMRLAASLAALALLSACATHRPQVSAAEEAAQYAAKAQSNYTPPGPAGDPWGPYVVEAAARFDVPEAWVRGVMRVESGGHLYENGALITSAPGAMGLMQVMPETYDELRGRYGLGNDPYDPHANILAGTAYIRELYEMYGSPGFLAAYNAGPRRLDDYLTRNRGLPAETRRYVAMIAPGIAGIDPVRVAPAQMLAMNRLPDNIPAGPRYPRRGYGMMVADNRGRRGPATGRTAVQTASLPLPPPAAPPERFAALYPPPASSARSRGGFRLIGRAMADTLPERGGGAVTGAWAIQVGAFANESLARSAAGLARMQARRPEAEPMVGPVRQAHGTLYRARLVGLSRNSAVQACEHLSHGRGGCIVLSPAAQS